MAAPVGLVLVAGLLEQWWFPRLVGGIGALGLGVAALLGVSAYMGHIITRPRRITVEPLALHQEGAPDDVTFRSFDGLTLHGWYFAVDLPRDAIAIGHGFAMSRTELLDLARGLRARGHAVLLFDFRAHGMSEGGRSTIGYHEADDIRSAVAYLGARPDLAGLRIGVAGISMGAAAALQAAARDTHIAAVVADSSFATLHDIAANGLRLLYRLPRFPFTPLVVRYGELFTGARISLNRPIDAVAAIAPRPLLLIHGEQDRLIPVADARALYAAAGEPKELWVVPGVRHASAFLADPTGYCDRLDRFFSAALRESTTVTRVVAATATNERP